MKRELQSAAFLYEIVNVWQTDVILQFANSNSEYQFDNIYIRLHQCDSEFLACFPHAYSLILFVLPHIDDEQHKEKKFTHAA